MRLIHRHATGFTITEMAVVLVIVALLLGGLIVPLSTQHDIVNFNATQITIDDVRDALVGFAIANDRLPCPAAGATGGAESPIGGGTCTNAYDGFVPAVTLGLPTRDPYGYLLDAWGNKIHYAVTTANSKAFTTQNGMKSYAGGFGLLAPDLYVCTTATWTTSTSCGTAPGSPPPTTTLANKAIAVIFSTGKNTATGGTGADEAANLANKPFFVFHEPRPATSANGEFDDIVTWLSPNILYNRMVAAGRLP